VTDRRVLEALRLVDLAVTICASDDDAITALTGAVILLASKSPGYALVFAAIGRAFEEVRVKLDDQTSGQATLQMELLS
jgi:hypothetical protein